MGGQISKHKSMHQEMQVLKDLHDTKGVDFPGSDYYSANGNHKEWMLKLNLNSVRVRDVVWLDTHDSATDKMGIPLLTCPLAQCQECSIYNQLVGSTRGLDLRVEASRRVCRGVLKSYKVDLVIRDIKRFLSDMESEFLIVEVRTKDGHQE
ncbi:hypothetical protein SUGI_0729930 [Cryptomeria japonica]|nr:hypothetical protein SUGI_0729930 [Cryptomeria japonica]